MLLIWLVYKNSPKQIGSYKYLMIYIAVFEISYSIIDGFLEPLVFSHNSIFLVFIRIENYFFKKEIYILLICIWAAFFGSFMAFFAVQFIYRYFVVSGSIFLKSFNDCRLLLWMCGPLICGISWGTVTYFTMHPNEQIDDVVRNDILVDFDSKLENITYIGSYLYRVTTDGCEKLNEKNLFGIIILLLIIVVSILTILASGILCFLKIEQYVRTTRNLSQTFNGLQHQLLYALITQTLIPVILMHIPVSIIFVSTVLSINIGKASVLVSVTIALFPALDPFPVILIVKHYRFAMMSAFTTPVFQFVRNRLDNPVN
ncbi:unnamed protein product [Caenorhabditis angaria]|uniref:Seven TM Receptor n=1 Tax=Caenorhabditis angaria TaxID=860376 RepID=A0A9P1IZF3_9PELO|nr:unnamed protein product [Caenorhabditis angaria]